jgi:hypothetical protein
MKMRLLLLFLLGISNSGVAQTNDWTDLTSPQGGVMGKRVSAGALTGAGLSETEIESEPGPDTYRQTATKHFGISLSPSRYDRAVFRRAFIDGMVVDYVSDNALYRNPDYLTNYFVYKGIRAKSITYYFSTANTVALNPLELIPVNAMTAINAVIPTAAKLTVSRTYKDTIALTITNPRVYFRVLVMQLRMDCDNCRQAFTTNIQTRDADAYLLDLADRNNRTATVTVPLGTKPTFQLYLDQDPTNPAKLKLMLELDEDFQRINSTKTGITSPLEIPSKPLVVGGRTIQQYALRPVEVYLGVINSGKKRLWSDISLNTPIYASVSAEQVNDSQIALLTRLTNRTFATKVEYTPYKYVIYHGPVN